MVDPVPSQRPNDYMFDPTAESTTNQAFGNVKTDLEGLLSSAKANSITNLQAQANSIQNTHNQNEFKNGKVIYDVFTNIQFTQSIINQAQNATGLNFSLASEGMYSSSQTLQFVKALNSAAGYTATPGNTQSMYGLFGCVSLAQPINGQMLYNSFGLGNPTMSDFTNAYQQTGSYLDAISCSQVQPLFQGFTSYWGAGGSMPNPPWSYPYTAQENTILTQAQGIPNSQHLYDEYSNEITTALNNLENAQPLDTTQQNAINHVNAMMQGMNPATVQVKDLQQIAEYISTIPIEGQF